MSGNFASQLRDKINAQFIQKLENGTVPWQKPWAMGENGGFPTSVSTRKTYRGINALVLFLVSEFDKNYTSKYWATFNQWSSIGASVKKGEKATTVVFYKQCAVKDSEGNTVKRTTRDGSEVDKTYALMRAYWVFNAEQVLDAPGFQYKPAEVLETFNNYEVVDKLIEATGAKITHRGDKAFYAGGSDAITMPSRKSFKTSEDYYATILHELGHWSQHANRCTWDGSYAFNELVVEIASVYVMGNLGLPLGHHIDNHASYIDNWLKALKNDNTFIFKATSQAAKVADYLLGFADTAVGADAEMETETAGV